MRPLSLFNGRRAACALLLGWLCAGGVAAQGAYPARPVRMVVPFAAGGPNDVMARLVAQQLTTATGQPFVVDNKAGAGGVIGTDLVAKAPADGYTIAFISGPFTMAPALMAKMPYDTQKDLAPVTKVAESPMLMMVPAGSRFKTAQELVDFAQKNPGTLNYGSGGIGSTPHLTTELLGTVLGARFTHVPYKGGGESIKALMAGEIDLLIDSITSTEGPLASGRVRPLAVGQARRLAKLPAVPTFEEAGIQKFGVTHWVGIVAPARVPSDVLATLHGQVVRALKAPELQQKLRELGAEPVGNPAADFGKFIAGEVANWQRTVRQANIQAQ